MTRNAIFHAALACLAAAALATPARATGGYNCTSPDGALSLLVTTGRGVAPAVVGARLEVGGRTRTLGAEGGVGMVVGQSWIDDEKILLDLADPNVMNHVARLRVFRSGGPLDYGYVRAGDRFYPVVCETDG